MAWISHHLRRLVREHNALQFRIPYTQAGYLYFFTTLVSFSFKASPSKKSEHQSITQNAHQHRHISMYYKNKRDKLTLISSCHRASQGIRSERESDWRPPAVKQAQEPQLGLPPKSGTRNPTHRQYLLEHV